MTKVAIPVFLDRISPRLDCAKRMLVLYIEENRLLDKREMDISNWPADSKVTHLKEMGVEQVICGGLRLEDRFLLNHAGILVAAPIYGEIETVIASFLKGRLKRSCCPCPGRSKRSKPGCPVRG
jgi:predicted Fe-Mo cluster-binding NifX family protein